MNGTMGDAGVQQNIDSNQPSTSNFNGNGLLHQQQPEPTQQQQLQSNTRRLRRNVQVVITEQPAGKALRFRYECEGRSAGSIPGINSTQENKTFPTIEIVNYKGRAVVVVSCVTKDPPYRPHPHNLVGKEGCKKGVCTLEINSETMRAVFSNLGIQCVKKKDIEAALVAREDIRVDPFKTGFSHKNQPSSIDLNSVRLCFQVFLESDVKGRFTVPLQPVVSEPIFDKKAMSDLVICRLCSCSSTVEGGKEIILLCEKVAKEDISVRFYEEQNGNLVWEGFGDFQHTDVHKQTAITFKTPRYKTLHTNEIVKVFIQLRRPSDGVVSEPLPFDFLPLDSGRRTFWAMRKNLKRKADEGIFQQILNEDKAAILAAKQASCTEVGCQSEVINLDTPTEEGHSKSFEKDDEEAVKRRMEKEVDSIIDEKLKEMELQAQEPKLEPQPGPEPAPEPKPEPQHYQSVQTQTQDSMEDIEDDSILEDISEPRKLSTNDKITDWLKSNDEFERTNESDSPPVNGNLKVRTKVAISKKNKTLHDLLDNSEELEEIYSENKLRIETFNNTLINELASSSVDGSVTKSSISKMEVEESFDDAATYTSLEMAFKNPFPMASVLSSMIEMPSERSYEPVEIIVDPPASLLNMPTLTANRLSFVGDENCPPLPPKRIRKPDTPSSPPAGSSPTPPARPPSQILIMKTPDQPPTKKLPPTPNNINMSRQKKPGFFSKLFSRRKSKSDLSQTSSSPGSKTASPMGSREPSVAHFSLNDVSRSSVRSLKSIQPSASSKSRTNGAKPERTVGGKPVGRSVSSVSGKRPHLTAEVIHIPLKGGDSSNSLPMHEAYSDASTVTLSNMLDRKTVSAMQLVDLPINDGNMELVAIADRQSLKNLCEDPAVLKHKRQKIGGDAMERLKQHKPLNEHLDGRAPAFLNVMQNPTIKTEPRDTSPLPYMFNNAYRMPDQTPSPQPVSPPNLYNHNTSGTPSPYHMGAGGTNGNMMSPNHHYYCPPPVAGIVNGSPVDFDAYHQLQQQQQQHQLQQQQAGSINQFNHMFNPTSQPSPQQWQGAPHFKQTMPSNINNLTNFNVNNPLTRMAVPSATSTSAQVNTNNNAQPWNIPLPMSIANNNYNIDPMLVNTQHNPHHQQQQPLQIHPNNVAGQGVAAVAVAPSVSTHNNDAPSISSLLNIDSEQLMDLNSAELNNLSLT